MNLFKKKIFIKIKMEICSADYIALVGFISAVVHIGVRSLIHMYPKNDQLLLNIMLVANVLLLVYFGMCIYNLNSLEN